MNVIRIPGRDKRNALDHYDCEGGARCYNIFGRPKLKQFDDCFPGKIGAGDIDFVVERHGWVIFAEWKQPGSPYDRSQQLFHLRLSALSPRIRCYVVEGQYEPMEISRVLLVKDGRFGTWRETDLDGFKAHLAAWSNWVSRQPKLVADGEHEWAPE